MSKLTAVMTMLMAMALVLCGGIGSAKENRPPEDMVFVAGGVFQMGNSFEEGDADERPVHEVELDSYMIGRHEVTVGEFRAFVADTGYLTTAEQDSGASVFVGKKVEKRRDANWHNVYYEQDDRHPVVNVSWYDAIQYCNWRSGVEGFTPCYTGSGDEVVCDFDADGYRLPTEAEWEYAARSRGKVVKYSWGDNDPYIDGRPAGNTRDEAARRQWDIENVWQDYDDEYAWTAPAGRFAANELGVCDISGSVYEWVWDWYDENYYEKSPRLNPTGAESGTMRACRDAGFACAIRHECVASRGLAVPSLAFSWGGFRIARSVR